MKRLRDPAILGVLLYGLQLLFYRGYVTDDTWIYARFARNLAEHGELSFNLGQPIHAATSPLWAALAAVGVRLGLEPIDVLLALGAVFGGLSVWLFARIVARMVGPTSLAFGATLVFSTEIWMVRWSASGMETALGVLWLLGVFECCWREPRAVPTTRLGILVGLGFLVRPEALGVAAILAGLILTRPELRVRRGFWIGLVAIPALWTLYAWPTYGHILPATLQAKSTPIGWQAARLLHNLRVLAGLYLIAAPLASVLWLVQMITGRGWREWRGEGAAWSEPAWRLWTLTLPVVYLVRDVQVISRYLELVLPVMLLWAIWQWSRRPLLRGSMRLRVMQGALAVQVLLSLALTVAWVAPRSRAFGQSLESGLGDLAEWVRGNTAPDDTIAVYDIGYLGAHCEREIIDLGGLVHPQINDLRDRLDDGQILRDGLFLDFAQPAVLIDRDREPDALDGEVIRGYRLEAILHRTVANLGLSRPEPMVYTLYRLVPIEG